MKEYAALAKRAHPARDRAILIRLMSFLSIRFRMRTQAFCEGMKPKGSRRRHSLIGRESLTL